MPDGDFRGLGQPRRGVVWQEDFRRLLVLAAGGHRLLEIGEQLGRLDAGIVVGVGRAAVALRETFGEQPMLLAGKIDSSLALPAACHGGDRQQQRAVRPALERGDHLGRRRLPRLLGAAARKRIRDVAGVQEQELLLGGTCLHEIDEPLQRPAVDLRFVAAEVLGRQINLPLFVLAGVADEVNDQPAVGGHQLEELRHFTLQRDGAGIVEQSAIARPERDCACSSFQPRRQRRPADRRACSVLCRRSSARRS